MIERQKIEKKLFVVVMFTVLVACAKTEIEAPVAIDHKKESSGKGLAKQLVETENAQFGNLSRNAYFGDLHVHTTYSFDAFSFGTLATPYDAYRYAKGEAIKHPGGFDVQLDRPLDFYAVTDHAMYLGVVRESADTSTELSKAAVTKPLHNLNAPENMGPETIAARRKTFRGYLPRLGASIAKGDVDAVAVNKISKDAWADTIKAAQQHYRPGEFTTFVAYEYTTSRNQGSLHRNVIFRGAENLPDIPYSRLESLNPEDLWNWMDGLRGNGVEALAIPHNSNGSNGQMFELTNWAGDPMDSSYTAQRVRNEPLAEITQVKGTSDTHPALSNNDEWADFEIMAFSGPTLKPSKPPGSYVRDALKRGLSLAARGVGNPYKYGIIGSSDTHNGAGAYDETNFFSKVGVLDADGLRRGSIPQPIESSDAFIASRAANASYRDAEGRVYADGKYPTWGASGLAAVWAEENTREAIYDAFRRKETFATSGPRMRVRLFAGYEFDDAMLESESMVSSAYKKGVAMGSDLVTQGAATPSFLVWATRDVNTAPLQRLQIIKGWQKGGKTFEQVYDVACSDGLKVDSRSHRCPDNGAKVNLSDCSISADSGAAELKALWRDPDFSASDSAFYYVRVLENPSCRWSTWDAVRAGVAPRDNLHKTIQERAWSSPIWFKPGTPSSWN